MAVTITAKQRDALYEETLIRFSGIDVVFKAAKAGELQKAQERGREYADLLLLVLNDLGWGDSVESETFELTTAPDVLRRSLNHLLGLASAQLALEEREHAALRAEMTEVQFVVDTCVDVLKELDGGESDS